MAKRRANHEGTIYKRQDGRWVASVVLPGGKRKYYYGKTREEVAQKCTVGLKAIQDGLPIPSDQLRVGRYLQEWLVIVQTSIKHGSFQRYRQLLTTYAIPRFASLSLGRFTPHHLETLYADCLKTLAPATVRQLHVALSRALGHAYKQGLILRNPTTLVTPPRSPRREIQPFLAEQVRTLLDASCGDRLEALYVLAVTCGMRQGELLALRWQDIDLDTGALHVQHTLVRTPNGLVLGEPKSARARRRISLTPMALTALRRQKAQQTRERLKAGRRLGQHGFGVYNGNRYADRSHQLGKASLSCHTRPSGTSAPEFSYAATYMCHTTHPAKRACQSGE